MDALKNIINNVPDWLKRLDELGDQIDQRQIQLASFGVESSARSIKNKGSTESLKPKDEGAEPDAAPVDEAVAAQTDDAKAAGHSTTPPQDGQKPNAQPSSPSSGTPSALREQTKQAMVNAQARARAEVKKRHRPDSVASVEEAPSKYRTKAQVEVYYDEFVQNFFEELVKFVSASRNLMRKAKMAAKVAQIRRLAELEVPDDDAGDSNPDTPLSAENGPNGLPSLRYMSTRRMGPRPPQARGGQTGGLMGDNAPDAYDELDKGLEYVQGMCEHAAHQFLRDGECREEIGNIQRRLGDTKELAAKEMERIEREEPELLKASETNKVRTLRPTSMRRELTPAKDSNPPITPRKLEVDAKLEVEAKAPLTNTVELDMTKPIAANDAPIEADDEGIDDMEISLPPRLNYRSTRAMRGPPVRP
ncbi:hypothetical protein CMUS01_08437 [Colletotrichum musicola]|uniref:Uncharacterized protein n=1 Tax=Colletotrichum musicola TaxID=2175873 RepID=A0A8H6ND10_9PEZI|nr:hypothetical protein CMUS01_08437 [Colletotrichum musicola]